ncbi:hypothetical protein D0T50_07540 [Bacteroides sp. 214]|uniref:acyltransferase n=1 Tax=Bacteroides sp. 214 TaxID=2302935 RepID=UPI0013D2BD6F|nr:acyltransferase family protein [Bacteroides sp. 214]NDW12741.1 hypothetical protein [Bacteroides sp. 214]
MMKEKKKWIDCLRVLATFCVIVLHVSAPLLDQYGDISNFDWWVGNIYDGSTRFSVPLFLLITGALILPQTYSSMTMFFKKRFSRVVLPFAFWSFIYIMQSLLALLRNSEITDTNGVIHFFIMQIKEGASFHLWYIYLILGLYLFFPIINKWIKNSNRNEILYFIVLWSIITISNLSTLNQMIPNIELRYFSGYIGVPIIGYYLITTTFNRKKAIYTSLTLITIGTLMTLIGTFFVTKQNNKFIHSFYEYLTPNVILTAVGVFMLFKHYTPPLNKKITSAIFFFSKYSYGIYLVHILVRWYLFKIGISYAFVAPIVGIPITSILCFVISAFIVWGINKVPYGKYISG